MLRQRFVPAAVVVATFFLAIPAAHAQYTDPGPTGGTACQPATTESPSLLTATPAYSSWQLWIQSLRNSLPVRLPAASLRTLIAHRTHPSMKLRVRR